MKMLWTLTIRTTSHLEKKANQLDGSHNYLRTMLMGRHDQQTVEMFVIDVVCSQTDNRLAYSTAHKQDTGG